MTRFFNDCEEGRQVLTHGATMPRIQCQFLAPVLHAFMSWLIVTGLVANATGNECAKIMPRTTMRTTGGGMSFNPVFRSPPR